jgi:hypothetical protein
MNSDDSRRYALGTIEASEQLIKELFLDLREAVNRWSLITDQTAQARMGYVGQHLVSVVTGYPGEKSGARGYDLIIDNEHHGEIKTCYRVDQLGKCKNCGAAVSAKEERCASCGSEYIERKDDSKWLIGIRNEDEFSNIVEPLFYYFVLFEYEDLHDIANERIIASVWRVDPKCPGFALALADYRLNIQANSTSGAPLNVWPYAPKSYLMNPYLIYRSVIHADNTVETLVFPNTGQERIESFDFSLVSRSTTISREGLIRCIRYFDVASLNDADAGDKKELAVLLQTICSENDISNEDMCDALALSIYAPELIDGVEKIPPTINYHMLEAIQQGFVTDVD